MRLIVLVTKTAPAAVLPAYANPGDAGAVLCALAPVRLLPGACESIRTGLAIALPDGHAGLIQQAKPNEARAPDVARPTDGAPAFLVAPSVLDAGFRGEIRVIVQNPHSGESEQIAAGQPIARLVIVPIVRASFAEAEKLPGSMRQ